MKQQTADDILARIVLNPGWPEYRSSGGKYVPPTIGLRSGVNHTLIGQPPRALVALFIDTQQQNNCALSTGINSYFN